MAELALVDFLGLGLFSSNLGIFFFWRNRMAAAAACRRWGRLETKLLITGFRGLGASTSICDPLSASLASVFPNRQLHCRQISQLVQSNGKRLFLVDTLALVISLLFLIPFF